jgi:uncharacterized protein
MSLIRSWLAVTALIFLFASCATYYQRNLKFNRFFESGNMEKALKTLQSDKKAEQRKTRLLYYLNCGVVYHMLDSFESSNIYFEKAYLMVDNYRKDNLEVVASFITNPNMITYGGEDHEILMIHYYKALNYIYLRQYEAALVECRRMNIKLNQLSDKYSSENKYKRDAFIHLLMGLIYDMNKEYNDAFIAYRNAYEIYTDDYGRLFNINVPLQLKYDLIRAAANNGFWDEVSRYEKEFGIRYDKYRPESELILFWQNGLGPIKDEYSINFSVVANGAGMVTFLNEEHGYSFPFHTGDEGEGNLSDLQFFRVALPKYLERPLFYTHGLVEVHGQKYNLLLSEDINAIAFKTLEERIIQELSTALLRLALKKAAEMALRKNEKKDAAFALNVINTISEQADTRNWQTLPHSILYTRIPLKAGTNELTLKTTTENGISHNKTFKIHVKTGEVRFYNYHSLEYIPVKR